MGALSKFSPRAAFSAAFSAALIGSSLLFACGAAHALDLALTPADRELPAFELPDLEEQPWTVENITGQPYIVNFWATWCGPCVHELPAMNRAAEQLIDEGVGMVAINIAEGSRAVEAFMQQVPIEFPVLLGDAKTFPNWSVKGLPTTYIVSAEGKIIAVAVGPREWDDPEFIDYMLSLRAE